MFAACYTDSTAAAAVCGFWGYTSVICLSLCNEMSVGVTWWRGPMPATNRAAASAEVQAYCLDYVVI